MPRGVEDPGEPGSVPVDGVGVHVAGAERAAGDVGAVDVGAVEGPVMKQRDFAGLEFKEDDGLVFAVFADVAGFEEARGVGWVDQ